MPTYQYKCRQCEHELEAVQSFSDAPLTECPVCGGALRKVFSTVGVVFKGSGFYRNDSRAPAKSETAASGSDSGAKSTSKSESKSGATAESKSSTKADGKSAAKPGTQIRLIPNQQVRLSFSTDYSPPGIGPSRAG